MFKNFKNNYLNTVLLVAIFLSLWSLSFAATPNPGHPWTEVGDGTFIVSGPSIARTYTFPDASTTVLTTNSLISVAQGGTGTSSLSGVLLGNGTSAVTATTSPAGLLVGTTEAQTLTGKTINASDNIITDTGVGVGYLFKSNGSKFLAFGTSTPFSYVRVNDAGTDLQWSASSGGPSGDDKQLQYNSGGSSWGATSSLTIDGNVLRIDNSVTMSTTSLPSVAATGTIKLFNREIAGRSSLKFRTSVMNDYSILQPNIFTPYFCYLTAGNSSGQNWGLGCINSGGGSNAANEVDGYTYRPPAFSSTAQFVSAGANMFVRGTTTSGQNGFFYFVRTTLPDSDYTNSSGVRLIYGLSDQTSANNICGSDNVSNQDLIAFNYSTALSADWRIAADDGSASTPTYTSTGIAFAASTTYDFYLYSPPYPDISNIYWRMDNLTNGTSTAEGSVSIQLPGASVMLRSTMCGDSVNNVTRNWRMETMYTEVPYSL